MTFDHLLEKDSNCSYSLVVQCANHLPSNLPFIAQDQSSQTGLRTLLGAMERFLGGHEQRLSLGSFAEVFINIARPKCHDIKYSPVKLKFVVSIILS